MAKLATLLEQHLHREPPTGVIQATTWWEAALGLVKLQECGLEVPLPVKVYYYYNQGNAVHYGVSVSKLHSTTFSHVHMSQLCQNQILHLLTSTGNKLSLPTMHGLHSEQSRNTHIGSNLSSCIKMYGLYTSFMLHE